MMSCRLRKADWDDCKLLYEWRNDPFTRKSFFCSGEISIAEHEAWLKEKLSNDIDSIYILEIDNEPAGQVRLDYKDNAAYISYSIAGKFRGQGYGKLLLQLLEKEVANIALRLIGQVKKDNIASQVVFQSLGYDEVEKEDFFEYSKIANNISISNVEELLLSGGGGGNPPHK